MEISFLCGRDEISIRVPDGSLVYKSHYPAQAASPADAVLAAVRNPIAAPPLAGALQARRGGDVVVVVSDITRPVPYAAFLPELLREIEAAGVHRDDVLILVATGMHRASTTDEHREMFGEIAGRYRIEDHDATAEGDLVELPGRSWSGARARVDRRYMEAGFRIITGLVEPHFMAGFSGGRKAICPGLSALETLENFHGVEFIDHPAARNANLTGNPLHEEALSVARMAGADFSLNLVLDMRRRLVSAFAGALEEAHEQACRFVGECACPHVERPADVALTSCGGYPLDATFYQCVKGFVSCLPAVRDGGVVIAFGGCSEGVGSAEYVEIMREYSGRWREFLDDIRKPGVFKRDQWEFQMHVKALAHVGQQGLFFVTDGLPQDKLEYLSLNPRAAGSGEVQAIAQGLVDELGAEGRTFAVFPEGPYCAPVPAAQ